MSSRHFKALVFFSLILPAVGQELPKVEQHDGRYSLQVDGKDYLVLGAQVHNSSGWQDVLNATWPTIRQLHANTIMVPVYWQAIEPQPGKYDFSTVDSVVKGARDNNVRLAVLWFGSWKNGGMVYTPSWVKTDQTTYPRVIGQDGHPVNALSPVSQKNADEDKAIFPLPMYVNVWTREQSGLLRPDSHRRMAGRSPGCSTCGRPSAHQSM